ncbi:hypothetical protein L6R53_14155 [Myxococcota bacterium]|nr:hypothetical protein [Myxococcota bacterium]
MTRLLERFRMSFELAAPLRPGDAADFRVFLDDPGRPRPVEVRGTLRILRILDAHPDAPSLFSAEIVDVRRDDLPELDAWLGQHTTPQGRRFEAITGSSEFEPDVDIDDSVSAATEPVDPLHLPSGREGATVSSAPFGLTEQSNRHDLRLAGREAIRTALRRGLQTRGARGQPPAGRGAGRESWLRTTQERARRQARAWLDEPEPRPAPGPAVDPVVEIDDERSPILVQVRWCGEGRYRDDYRRHLKGGGLFVPTVRPLPRGAVVEVVLTLPDGVTITCLGRVVAPMPTGAGLSLDLAPHDAARLAAQG